MSLLILVTGTKNSGKTSLYNIDIPPSISDKEIVLIEEEYIFESDISTYDGVIFVYDTTNILSLDDPYMRYLISLVTSRNIPTVVFGNKDDVIPGVLSIWKAEQVIPSNIPLIFGSTLTGKNIREVISRIVLESDNRSIWDSIYNTYRNCIHLYSNLWKKTPTL